MLAIREHLHCCSSCCEEYEALSQTKRLVSSLALKAPRAELEALLMREAETAEQPWSSPLQWLPGWISDRVESLVGDTGAAASGGGATAASATMAVSRLSLLRLKPLAATAMLSIAGFCLASATVDGPSDLAAPSAEVADLFSAPAASDTVAAVTNSELRELRPVAASNTLSATTIPVSYTGSSSLPVSVNAGNMASASFAVAPARLISSPVSLSVSEGASPTIWQAAGVHSPSILLSVQRALFPR